MVTSGATAVSRAATTFTEDNGNRNMEQFFTDHPTIAGAIIGSVITGIFAVAAAWIMRGKLLHRSVEHKQFHLRQKKARLRGTLQRICPHVDRQEGQMLLGIRNNKQVYDRGVCIYCDQWLHVSKARQKLGRVRERILLMRRNYLTRKLDGLGSWRTYSTINEPTIWEQPERY